MEEKHDARLCLDLSSMISQLSSEVSAKRAMRIKRNCERAEKIALNIYT